VLSLVGVSLLAAGVYLIGRPLPWVLLAVTVLVIVVLMTGAYALWDQADEAAWRFAPTWETMQHRADILLALLETNDGDDKTFRRSYMAGHMASARRDYDRGEAAGHRPDLTETRLAPLAEARLPSSHKHSRQARSDGARWSVDRPQGPHLDLQASGPAPVS
jgi:hypothetical protein